MDARVMSAADVEVADPDARWLAVVMHIAFFVLLCSSLTRYLMIHPRAPATPWVIVLAVVLALLYVLGPVLGGRSAAARLWLAGVIGVWLALVILAPSFGWCAVSLFYTGLRSLSTRSAIVLVALLTAFVVAAQVKLRMPYGFDPNLIFGTPAVAAVAAAVFIYSKRQTARLVSTRRELAATERREGTLAERQRLSMEIHDTLAQGLSSQQMLLQAADRLWDTDPATARGHVRAAELIGDHNLAESRRFIHDLAPADLANGVSLSNALRTLAERETAFEVRFHEYGTPAALPERVESTLVRIAQGALANVREHANAGTATLTLSYFDDQVALDIADDGRGFEPGERSGGERGHGLPGMRARVQQLDGTLTVESVLGEGTVVSAAIPLPARF
ncbi:histidine kinase [Nonomuraea sp. NPDC050556]|uniref:sensor histidine kinase n=1 Tax=Nonomuraea sp. NPDC050556 TaxID=3364369 RepID=UPI0037B1F0F7